MGKIIYRHLLKLKNESKTNQDCQMDKENNTKVPLKILTVPTNGVDVEALMIDGVSVEIYKPTTYDYTVIYIHGGGFISGSVESYRKYVTWFCKTNRCKAISIDYRLAPLHPYPEGLNDCFKVYKKYIELGEDLKTTVFMGDSAGGNLVLALALKAKDEHLPLPGAIIPMCPVTSLDVKLPSHLEKEAVDCIIKEDFIEEVSEKYIKEHKAIDPYISVINGNFIGFPPTYITVGGREMLLDDSLKLNNKLVEQGVKSKVKIYPKMYHVFQVMWTLPEAKKCSREIDRFIRSNMKL
jgi:acetyl esterase/lipase